MFIPILGNLCDIWWRSLWRSRLAVKSVEERSALVIMMGIEYILNMTCNYQSMISKRTILRRVLFKPIEENSPLRDIEFKASIII